MGDNFTVKSWDFETVEWYHEEILSVIYESQYNNSDMLALVEDCDSQLNLWLASEYKDYKCYCGVDWKVRYVGTKETILEQVKLDVLNNEYIKNRR